MLNSAASAPERKRSWWTTKISRNSSSRPSTPFCAVRTPDPGRRKGMCRWRTNIWRGDEGWGHAVHCALLRRSARFCRSRRRGVQDTRERRRLRNKCMAGPHLLYRLSRTSDLSGHEPSSASLVRTRKLRHRLSLFSVLPPFNIGNSTMGYGLGGAGAAASMSVEASAPSRSLATAASGTTGLPRASAMPPSTRATTS